MIMKTFLVYLYILTVGSTNAGNQISSSSGERCGVVSTTHKNEGKFPWTAKLKRINETIADEYWPAIILSASLALTRINSVQVPSSKILRIYPKEDYFVYANLTIFGQTNENADIRKSGVTHIRLHPEYTIDNLHQNDIIGYALVHLSTPLKFDQHVVPICLPSLKMLKRSLYSQDGNGSEMIVSGRNALQEYLAHRLIIEDEAKCQAMWEKSAKDILYQNIICANVTATLPPTRRLCVSVTDEVGVIRIQYPPDQFYLLGLLTSPSKEDCVGRTHVFVPKLNATTINWIQGNMKCGPHLFTCNDGTCVPLEVVCNRIADCKDKSDEDLNYCHGLNYCPPDRFRCGNYGKCISKDKLCDNIKHCEVGEDERGCPNAIYWKTILGSVCGGIFIIFGIICLIIWKRRESISEFPEDLVEKFLNGFTSIPQKREEQDCNYVILQDSEADLIDQQKWNTEEYEISQDMLRYCRNRILGRGQYGIVYAGVYKRKCGNGSTNKLNVAVKTFKSCPDLFHFKDILTELKVMAYVGRHENIVELIGANTAAIRKRHLYVVMELCIHGNLKNFLQEGNYYFLPVYNCDRVNDATDCLRYGDKKTTVTISALIRWCYQIAQGMEYIASKRVIHGDLAARNILLSDNYNAKLGDFGLSRKLYEYSTYFHSNRTLLPWRWLAVESLRDLAFSTKSDIWSFGVTVWEILTLGEEPYKDLEWDPNFQNRLCNGLVLHQPVNASDITYNWLKKCWSLHPEDRPNFGELKNWFVSQTDQV